jgi:hemoglobin
MPNRAFMTKFTLCVLATVAAAGARAGGTSNDASLYERLGGAPAVTQIANELIDRVAADPRLGESFKDSNLKRVKQKLDEQLCEISGGPCRYSGDSMRESHAGHHITEAHFYGMVETLKQVLRERHVGLRETNELLRLLAPMKRDIVEPPASGTRP